MSRRLEYFFDYVSPFSYLADSQLPGLAERTGAEILYRPMLLGGVIEKAGLDAGRILERAAEQPIKHKLRANTEEAVSRGAFGAPTFFVSDEIFWGNDRLDFLEEALRAQ